MMNRLYNSDHLIVWKMFQGILQKFEKHS